MTFDEPHHLATGLDWWQFGTYRWWTENPPLPKMLTALGPYLSGVRLPGPSTTLTNPWDVGTQLLEAGGARTLLLARLGTLPWLLLALGFTFALAGGWAQLRPAFVATALVRDVPAAAGPRRPGDDGHRGGGDGAGLPAGARSLGRPPVAAGARPSSAWRWRWRRCAS